MEGFEYSPFDVIQATDKVAQCHQNKCPLPAASSAAHLLTAHSLLQAPLFTPGTGGSYTSVGCPHTHTAGYRVMLLRPPIA